MDLWVITLALARPMMLIQDLIMPMTALIYFHLIRQLTLGLNAVPQPLIRHFMVTPRAPLILSAKDISYMEMIIRRPNLRKHCGGTIFQTQRPLCPFKVA